MKSPSCFNYFLIKSELQNTSEWSGGKTTEIFIYPQDSSYVDRNFKWRISSAKIEIPESIFTKLVGYKRYLMVLENEIILNHENQHSKTLRKYDFDCFDGSWNTTSQGLCCDFNLIIKEGVSGKISYLNNSIFLGKHLYNKVGFYSLKNDNSLSIVSKNGDSSEKEYFSINLNKHDFIIFDKLYDAQIDIKEAIMVEINDELS